LLKSLQRRNENQLHFFTDEFNKRCCLLWQITQDPKMFSLNTAVWRRWIYYAYNQTCRQEHSYNYTKA